MDATTAEELNLADDLKCICDDRGKEKDQFKSADIFDKLGLLYKQKSPDKISLIQSATLLNAAIFRQPENDKFQSDLDDLCFHVLKLANAANQHLSLRAIAEEVAKLVQCMRKDARQSLDKLCIIPYTINNKEWQKLKKIKIQNVQLVQDKVTDAYTEIMDFISRKCIDIMGKPPCQYSIIGMGSLARREISPYSDFEHVIVLQEGIQVSKDYPLALEYFRWYTVIFQIILINLQETIIPSVAIPVLNDVMKPKGDWYFDAYTTRGISFDGLMPHACKCPLGRTQKTRDKPWTTELIKPLSEMLNYLDSQQILKNGYHLGDILTKTCFVAGSKEMYEAFRHGAETVLKQSKRSNHAEMMKQLDEDLKNFDTFDTLSNLTSSGTCNIKRVVYRTTTLFIAALSRLYSISENCCFDIVETLKRKHLINEYTAHLLSFAVAVACEVRLKVYMKKKSQNDYIGKEKYYGEDDNKIIAELTELIGKKCLVEYFVIATLLQEAMKLENPLKRLDKTLEDTSGVRFNILHFFSFDSETLTEWEAFQQNSSATPLHNEMSIRFFVAKLYEKEQQFDKALPMFEWLDEQENISPDLKVHTIISRAWGYRDTGRNKEGIKYLAQAKNMISNLDINPVKKLIELGWVANTLGWCRSGMGQYDKALEAFKMELEYYHDSLISHQDLRISRCLLDTAQCLMKLEMYEEAIQSATQSLNIRQKKRASVSSICRCYNILSKCYLMQGKDEEVLIHLGAELEMRLQVHPEEREVNDSRINEIKKLMKKLKNEQILKH